MTTGGDYWMTADTQGADPEDPDEDRAVSIFLGSLKALVHGQHRRLSANA
jgi:hypothetical protein